MAMHHLPRLFRHHKKGEGKMDHKQQRRLKPKLDRRNAMKNVDYDASSSPSSSEYSSSSAHLTQSLDLKPYPNRTSFRVDGSDGDFDRICISLGLSGPEDFAIPAAAWEAMKARSISEPLPRSNLQQLDSQPETPIKNEEQEPMVDDGFPVSFADTIRFSDDELIQKNESSQLNDCRDSLPVGSCYGGVVGIKGARPPAVLTPPPLMLLPVSDSMCSTWDIMKSFAPQDDRGVLSTCAEGSSEDADEENGEFEENGKDNGAIVEREEMNGLRFGETAVLSESCSYKASNSRSTTEHLYNISPNGRFKRQINSWIKGGLLGSGSFGTVYEGIADDGFFFAVKEVSLLDQGSQGKQSIYQLEQEIALLSQFEHENIVQYLGTDKDEGKLYIFLELVTQGSLASLYQKYQLLDSQVSAYTRQILSGLKYLHERNVVHRDIKCANILVHASGSVKLADFGLAKATKLNDVKSCKGTAFWMAPEVVNRKNHGYGLAADIWSLGCTVLEMLTRQLPYFHLECMQALFRIGKGERPKVPNSLSTDARDFILQCLKVNPDERPPATQLLDHPFVKRPLPASSSSISPRKNGRRF